MSKDKARKKYDLAKEKLRWEYYSFVEQTNCTDKKNGHTYEWLSKKDHPNEAAEILNQHPSLKYGCICRCLKCGKVTSST